MQTLFNREHNRIADQLSLINPTWTDDKIFNETRKIVIAVYQHIIYNDWLPLITANSSLKPLTGSVYYNGYDSNINPAIANEFASAAFRFGHSLIRNSFHVATSVNPNQNTLINFADTVFKSDPAYK
jgi:peroxidase